MMMKIMNNIEEVWKDIPGFEGLYQASTLGQIRSIDRYETYQRRDLIKPCTRLRKGRILVPKYDKDGYHEYNLCKNGIVYYCRGHQLIALTFIPNPNNYTVINHINGIRDDNVYTNLEWCTIEYNNRYRANKEVTPCQ